MTEARTPFMVNPDWDDEAPVPPVNQYPGYREGTGQMIVHPHGDESRIELMAQPEYRINPILSESTFVNGWYGGEPEPGHMPKQPQMGDEFYHPTFSHIRGLGWIGRLPKQ